MYQSNESEMEGGGASSKMKISLSLKSLVVVRRAHSFREKCLQMLYDCDTGPGPEALRPGKGAVGLGLSPVSFICIFLYSEYLAA